MKMIGYLIALLVVVLIIHKALIFFGVLKETVEVDVEKEINYELNSIQTYFPGIIFDYELIDGVYELHATNILSLSEEDRDRLYLMIDEMVCCIEEEFYDVAIDVVYHD